VHEPVLPEPGTAPVWVHQPRSSGLGPYGRPLRSPNQGLTKSECPRYSPRLSWPRTLSRIGSRFRGASVCPTRAWHSSGPGDRPRVRPCTIPDPAAITTGRTEPGKLGAGLLTRTGLQSRMEITGCCSALPRGLYGPSGQQVGAPHTPLQTPAESHQVKMRPILAPISGSRRRRFRTILPEDAHESCFHASASGRARVAGRIYRPCR
jgi:hypothetical protein